MAKGRDTDQLTRTSVLVKEETHRRLHELAAKGGRPLSWEIRRALEEYVQRQEKAPEEEPAAA